MIIKPVRIKKVTTKNEIAKITKIAKSIKIAGAVKEIIIKIIIVQECE